MATKKVWIGSVGPYLYEDTDSYADSGPLKGLRAEQIRVEQAAIAYDEVVRLGEASSGQSGADSSQDSKIASNSLNTSEVESGVDSLVDKASVVESKVDSNVVYISTVDSKVDSAHP